MAPRKSSGPQATSDTKGTRISSRIAQKAKDKSSANLANASTSAGEHKAPALSTMKSKTNRVTKAATKTKSATQTKSKASKSTTVTTKSAKSKAPAKKSTSTAKKASTTNGVSKRKRGDDQEETDHEAIPTKKAKVVRPIEKSATTKSLTDAQKAPSTTDQHDDRSESKTKSRPAATSRPSPEINKAPTQKLNCFVFGENGSGELGLGHMHATGKRVIDVKRPRLNPKLASSEIGVVQLACGGMHAVALTHDNKILTWGVNDQGSLGRDTKGGEQYKKLNEKGEEESDDDDEMNSGLNAREAAPAEADYINIPEGTVFTKVAAGDSVTMVLTSTGLVYGCGTFRSNEGILGFTKEVQVQSTLALLPSLKNITDIACGANHVMALDNKGRVFAFGSGQQNQLGRRIVERTMLNSLVPTTLSFPRSKIQSIFSGSYHSFAIDEKDRVWGWGLNSFGQTGIPDDAGTDGGAIIAPTLVDSLSNKKIQNISGGTQHSVAVNGNGEVLAWGRSDGCQIGQDLDDIPEANFFRDETDAVVKRLVLVPTVVPDIEGATFACASGSTNIAINAKGKAYSWGFSANYQTGQGTDEDVEEATEIDNTAVREEKLVWCGIGGQYGMLTSVAKEATVQVNGVAH